MRFANWMLLGSGLAVGLLAACSSSDPNPVVDGAATILDFTISPTSTEAGQEVLLTWKTKGATSVKITDDHGGGIETGGDLSGTHSLRPAQTTTFTLTATGKSGNKVTRDSTVQVTPSDAPTITFKADPALIEFGAKTLLTWSTTGATQVVLRTGDEVLVSGETSLSGELERSLENTAIFELTATGPGGETSATAKVEVAPAIISFNPTSTLPVRVGEEVSISWQTAGAETLVLDSLDGFHKAIATADERASGSMTVPVGPTGIFRLSATRDGVAASKETQVTILGAPRIKTLKASPAVVTATPDSPVNVTISWEVDDAAWLDLVAEPGGTITVGSEPVEAGSVEWQVKGTTTFTLTAHDDANVTSVRTVTVESVPLPSVDSFVSSQQLVGAGDPFELTWTTSNATSVTIERDGASISPLPLQPNGSREQQLTTSGYYVLKASNAADRVVEMGLHIDVGVPLVDSFQVEPEQVVPGSAFSFTWSTQGATSLQILDADGTELADCNPTSRADLNEGSCSATAPASGGTLVYELKATNGSGTTVEQLTVVASAGPRVLSFTATPLVVTEGGSVTFHWKTTTDAAATVPSLELTDDQSKSYPLGAANPLDGSISVTLVEVGTYDFTLTASTGMGTATESLSVQVVAAPTVSFVATPPAYHPGNPSGVVLSWQSQHATSVSVYVLNPLLQPMGAPIKTSTAPAVVASGSHTVFPAGDTSYGVVVKNAAGTTAEANVTVPFLGPGIMSFDASDFVVTAGSTVNLSWSTAGGKVSLSPMVELPSSTAPYIDVSNPGNEVIMESCGSPYLADEGCVNVLFGNGFSFPFDGMDRDTLRIFANGYVGFDLTAMPGFTQAAYTLPSSANSFVHIAPFWTDLWPDIDAFADPGVFYELRTQPDDHAIIQWKQNIIGELYDYWIGSEVNVELLMWENGSFEFRYGLMWAEDDWWTGIPMQSLADGQSASIGYQNATATDGYMLNPGHSAIPGGLSNSSWRAERDAPATGSIDVKVRQTTEYELCVTSDIGEVECSKLTVTVN